jgi:hypothetical protein
VEPCRTDSHAVDKITACEFWLYWAFHGLSCCSP